MIHHCQIEKDGGKCPKLNKKEKYSSKKEVSNVTFDNRFAKSFTTYSRITNLYKKYPAIVHIRVRIIIIT